MKTLISVLILLTASVVWADSQKIYLTCEPPVDTPACARVVEDGIELESCLALEEDMSFRYDISDRPDGEHIYTVQYCNMRGCSPSSDPIVLPSIPQRPTGVAIGP